MRILILITDLWNRPYRRRRSAGYTLIELLAVSVIISILAAISFAMLSRMRSQVIETNALAAMNSLATGYEMYYFIDKSYPQWGDGQRFSSPTEILDHLINEEFIPRSWSKYDYYPDTGYIFGLTRDYAFKIPEYNPANGKNSYYIVLYPYHYQHDALAIGTGPPWVDPETGNESDQWVAIRPRRGSEGDNYRTYGLFIFKREGAGE